MSRGLKVRIQKLEARRHNDGEILLLWRLPDEDIKTVAAAAKKAGLFSSGDRVISAEWLGADLMPAPRWVQVKPSGFLSLTEREHEYREVVLRKLIDDRAYDSYPDPTPLSWTDADLGGSANEIGTACAPGLLKFSTHRHECVTQIHSQQGAEK